jgi:2-polyprenyl-3-methyl-5-hydroxy-6-metoxy-1,4-benzoquinol methylase
LLQSASKRLSRKNLYPHLTSQLSRMPVGARVLNVGAGGEVLAVIMPVARRLKMTVVSSDIDPRRGPEVVDDITQSGLRSGALDAVVMMEVLEHVRAPQAAVDELARLLKPGGVVVLSTPFIFPLHDRPHDYYRYTKYGLAHLFRNFDDVVVRERNSWSEAILVLLARLGAVGGRKGRIAAFIVIPLALMLWPLALLASTIVPDDYLTTGYVVTARRPHAGA